MYWARFRSHGASCVLKNDMSKKNSRQAHTSHNGADQHQKCQWAMCEIRTFFRLYRALFRCHGACFVMQNNGGKTHVKHARARTKKISAKGVNEPCSKSRDPELVADFLAVELSKPGYIMRIHDIFYFIFIDSSIFLCKYVCIWMYV